MYVNTVGRRIAPVLLAALLPALPARATQLMFDVLGERISYDTMVGQPGRYTTALWMNTSNVHPAYAWIPGQLDDIGPRTITLSSNDNSTTFNMELTGVVYGGISSNLTKTTAPSGEGGSAAGAEQGSSYTIYSGAAQSYGTEMYQSTSTARHSPFTIVRPLFNLDTTALLAALKGLPSGTYTAALPLSYRYKVLYEQGGTWSHEIRPLVLTFQVKYLGLSLNEITVTGTGEMKTDYTEHSTEVTGNTSWTVSATGMIPAGISMKFAQPDHLFEMKPTVATEKSGTQSIPYNLTINNTDSVMGNDDPNTLVQNGKLTAGADTVIIKPASGTESLKFELKADFTQGYIPSGTYTDQFTVLFQVVVE